MKSTPVCAISPIVSRETPPEASNGILWFTILTASTKVDKSILSKSSISAPASRASLTWSSRSHSTSTLTKTGMFSLTFLTASFSPPQRAIWLSLIITPLSSPSLWFCPPPQVTACFSRILSPGVVFLVSKSFAFVLEIFATYLAVWVAIPDICCSRLSAVRSPIRILRAGPAIVAITSPIARLFESWAKISMSQLGSHFLKIWSAASIPDRIRSSRAFNEKFPYVFSSIKIVEVKS